MLKKFNKKFSLVLIGNLLEFYDLGLFGFLAIIITPLYFPCEHAVSSLLASAGVFAIGFVMRPIGALIFGYIGDTFGRRVCLSNTILLMAIPTTVISVLPTYEQIGLLAPIILTLCRMFQGFCTGGEYNNAAIYLLENVDPNKKGFFSGLMIASSILGFFLASIVAWIVTLYYSEYSSWSWRLPFFLGALIGVVGFYLRKKNINEIDFHSRSQESFYRGFRANWKNTFAIICIGWLAGTLSLSLVGFMASYLVNVLKVPLSQATLINNIGLGVYVLLLPIFGFFSDQWGYRRLMLYGALATIFLSYPFFYLLSSGFFFSGQIGLAILAAVFLAPMHAYMLELFPVSFRCRGISTAFAIGVGIFGGAAPFVSTILVQSLKSPEAPALYYILSGVFGLIALKLCYPSNVSDEQNLLLEVFSSSTGFKSKLKAS